MSLVRAPLVEVELITPGDASMAVGYLWRLIRIWCVLGYCLTLVTSPASATRFLWVFCPS